MRTLAMGCALFTSACSNESPYGEGPELCLFEPVDSDFVTPWGTPMDIAATGAGQLEIEWNTTGNPIPTQWSLEVEPNILEAWVCSDFDDQIHHIEATGTWVGPDGLRLPANQRTSWLPNGRLSSASFLQADVRIPHEWLAVYEDFLVDIGYRRPGDPGELVGLGLSVRNTSALLRPHHRLSDGREWYSQHLVDWDITQLNGVLISRDWPQMNGLPPND